MRLRWRNSAEKPSLRDTKSAQIFGTKNVIRSRFVAFAAFLLIALLTLVGANVMMRVAFEGGPSGHTLIAQNNVEPIPGPLFDFAAVAPEDAPEAHRHQPTESVHPSQRCNRANGTNQAGFDEVYTFAPMHLEWLETSLARACGGANVLMPEWFKLVPEGLDWMSRNYDINENAYHPMRPFLDKFDFMPVVTVYGFEGRETLLSDTAFQRRMVHEMKRALGAFAPRGICLNVSVLNTAGFVFSMPLVQSLVREFKQAGMQSCLILDSYQAETLDAELSAMMDTIVVKGFRTDLWRATPQPLADNAWFTELVTHLAATIPEEKLVLMLGAGGRDWKSGFARSEEIDFATALEGTSLRNGTIRFASVPGNTMATYLDESGHRHQIWLLDAISTFNQIGIAREAGLARVGVWGLGYEDATVWELFKQPPITTAEAAELLGPVDLSDSVRYSGEGPFLNFHSDGVAGLRHILFDATTRQLTGANYSVIPRPYSVRRWGQTDQKLVALTFDDGPDPEFTKQVLDVLLKHDVQATFFTVGSQMIGQEELVRRIAGDDHLMGAHTFFHTKLDEAGDAWLTTELNLQSRVFASMVGAKPVLFRAPYVRGPGPINGDVAGQMKLVDELGYVITGSDIVPPDWDLKDEHEITNFVADALEEGVGNVILLHDGGGDRNATVAALPYIIERLRRDGYEFVDLAELAGFSYEEFMPQEPGQRIQVEAMAFSTIGWISNNIGMLLLIIIGLRGTRALGVFCLALIRGQIDAEAPGYRPTVTVVVPAYNEEKVITKTIRTILASTYKNLSVLVVNDGSTDDTEAVVKKGFANDPRVKIITQRNGGKWKAANTAFSMVTSEIVVAIDADTLVDPDAIGYLIQNLADPEVAAVAGNVKVGNERKLLTKLQAIEYVTSQNIDRRAFELFNGMMVVPGAIGAWRTDVVRDVGFYSADTMTEDADLTVSILRAGYRVVFEERAYTYTEAPESIRAFLAQRLRWTLGMMQTAWKHKGSIWQRTRVGLITLPDYLVFGVLVPLLSPVIDIIVLYAIINLLLSVSDGGPVFAQAVPISLIVAYFALPLFEALTIVTAFKIDPRARMRLLFYLPLMRVFYAQLLTFSLYRAMWRALTGRLASWNKLKRTASVYTQFNPSGGVRASAAVSSGRSGNQIQ